MQDAKTNEQACTESSTPGASHLWTEAGTTGIEVTPRVAREERLTEASEAVSEKFAEENNRLCGHKFISLEVAHPSLPEEKTKANEARAVRRDSWDR